MNQLTIQNMPELPFDVEEAINQLRVNLGFCGNQIKIIMITSSIPGEGKSFIAMNLWHMLANLGNRTLLIDCDLRRSELRTRYGISSREKLTGVAHYLAGKVELDNAIYKTNIVNGFFMPVAATIVNPAILLESKRFAEMMERCAEQFDYILVDTPPLENVADALRIATHTDGVVMVVHSGKTSRKIVENSVVKLKRTGIPLLGLVLNHVDISARSYYRHYYSGYGKGYGRYGYGKKQPAKTNK